MNTRLDLAALFGELQFKTGAEIGVAGGRYSLILLDANPHLTRLICVDPWQPYGENWRSDAHQEETYQAARAALSGLPAELWRMTSLEASLRVEDASLDFVFIDGAHDFDNVMLDVILWARKVKRGGIVSGHDYMHFTRSGVVEAVNAYTQWHRIELNVIGRNPSAENRDDRQPCWWFKNG